MVKNDKYSYNVLPLKIRCSYNVLPLKTSSRISKGFDILLWFAGLIQLCF